MRVALLCEEAAGLRTLQLLARSPHEIVAVLTSSGSAAWNWAQKLGLAPLPAGRVREGGFAEALARLHVEIVLNVHSLYIVPEAVLRVPAHGAYNLHPGPLPEYAGLNAPSWAIYHGEAFHGVTLHRMEPGIDTGPIAYQTRFPIAPEDTGLSLSLRCAEEGLRLVERLLAAEVSKVPLEPQDLRARRYFGREVPQGGRIDWTMSARRVHAFVRACDYRPFASPWGTPQASLGEVSVQVLKTALTGTPCRAAPGTIAFDAAGRMRVACADEWLELVRTAPELTSPAPGRASASRAQLSGSAP
jgi:methionyl-tRNA formyltransferase